MKIGIVISTKDTETAWNAFRLGNFCINEGDDVSVFLLGQGVECQASDVEPFNVVKQAESFMDSGGKILACGACMEIRQQKETKTCPVSSMRDLYILIRESDRVITF
jgi:uncharacterized protein involved in oxidation of intracellular sulfur